MKGMVYMTNSISITHKIIIQGGNEQIRQHLEQTWRRKFTEHDNYFLPLIANYNIIVGKEHMNNRYTSCTEQVTIRTWQDNKHRNRYRAYRQSSCKDKFCNLCSWQEAKQNKYRIAKILQYCAYKVKKKLLFIRLSRKNCSADDVAAEVNLLNKAFNRFIGNRQIQKYYCGHVKKLEVTYNPDSKTYNPHIHLLLVTEKDMKPLDWLSIWRKVCKDNTISHVNNRYRINIAGNKVFKLANYLTKPPLKDYDKTMQEAFNALHTALQGKQLLSCGGICRERLAIIKEKEG